MQLTQLMRADRGGRTRHQVHRRRSLWKRHHITDGRLARQQRHDSVNPKRDPSVWWCTVFERLEEKSEPCPRVLITDLQELEDASLQTLLVDPDTPAPDLPPL